MKIYKEYGMLHYKKKSHKIKILCRMHTTETPATRSNIIIPASAKARLAQDITTGISPANKNDEDH